MSIKMHCKPVVMTDKNQTRLRGTAFTQQKIDKCQLTCRIKCRRGFVGNQYLGASNQGAGGSDALLLPDTQFGRGFPPKRWSQIQVCQ